MRLVKLESHFACTRARTHTHVLSGLRSFFFWMDALGTVSMIFEISTLLGSGGKMQTAAGSVDAMLIRTARAAKARSGCEGWGAGAGNERAMRLLFVLLLFLFVLTNFS